MMVELKNGETLNGFLLNCDTWMNLTLRDVTQTSAEGDKFMQLPEVYVRGNNVGANRAAKEKSPNETDRNSDQILASGRRNLGQGQGTTDTTIRQRR
jgi:U6 snRNA-associated Sm-like protein LSm4